MTQRNIHVPLRNMQIDDKYHKNNKKMNWPFQKGRNKKQEVIKKQISLVCNQLLLKLNMPIKTKKPHSNVGLLFRCDDDSQFTVTHCEVEWSIKKCRYMQYRQFFSSFNGHFTMLISGHKETANKMTIKKRLSVCVCFFLLSSPWIA